MSFVEISKEIASDFLQTALVIDDEVKIDPRTEAAEEVTSVRTPVRGGANRTESQDAIPSQIRDPHRLNAYELMQGFSDAGMVCGIIPVNQDLIDDLDTLKDRAYKAALRSDFLILDWKIGQAEIGKVTTEIIAEILSHTVHKERLRLICIYTGEDGLPNIIDNIYNALQPSFELVDSNRLDDFTITVGATRITIYAKYGNPPDRVVIAEKLPEKLIDEFVDMTSGIISNVAIKAMSTIRDNTFLLLNRVNRNLDPPFLSHMALLPNPEDACEHVVNMITSELSSLLEDYEIGRVVNDGVLKAWVEDFELTNQGLFITINNDLAGITYSSFLDILKSGIEKWLENGSGLSKSKTDKLKKTIHKELTKAFLLTADSHKSEELDSEFAILTSISSSYAYKSNRMADATPKLTLGTIISRKISGENGGEKEQYYLCVQPKCDSVRIETTRSFPLLPLELANDNQKFDVFVKSNDSEYFKFLIQYNPYDIVMCEFAPDANSNGVIRATADSGLYYFHSIGNPSVKYKWVCELKTQHAQRIANVFASISSRVGLDESEWLRRSSN